MKNRAKFYLYRSSMKNSAHIYASAFNILCLILSFCIMILTGCVSRKDIAYFHDLEQKSEFHKQGIPELTIQKGDLLDIQVYSSDPEAMIPFNLQLLNTGGQLPSYSNGIAVKQGYLVNTEGKVSLPVLGDISVAGLTFNRCVKLLKEELGPYLKDLVVHIRLLNFKVTVLGDVRQPGTFTIPNERISLLEALGIAGDLNISAIRKNILLIREIQGIKTSFRIDLTSQDSFRPEVYYLSQNDVIYVEPNRAQRNAGSINARAGIFISAASLFISFIILVR